MDYIRQLNGFWGWRRANKLSHAQADLYNTILACANAARWQEEIPIPNLTISEMCGISKTQLHENRRVLVRKGLITYRNGKKGSCGVYTITPLYGTDSGTDLETNPVTELEVDLETDSKTDIGTDPKTNPGTNARDIYIKKWKKKKRGKRKR